MQATLKANNSGVTAPRVVTGPILLTGLARCASCDGATTLHRYLEDQGDPRILHLLDLRPDGQIGLQGTLRPHGYP